ncbi:hypothetical protein BE15_30675 [Sorangium cellulosum]|uniref:Uncharacterized protein n=2 Tax=Sorangium cellulosum TaxID=56 RepID=A0A150QSB5_SORCE|nr:hypothetical protein BE15_30675 [Sorangium cellulosum]
MQGRTAPSVPEGVGLLELTRARIEPMVRGLFPAREHDAVLGVLESSIVFLTPHNIETLLAEVTWPGSAWTLANERRRALDELANGSMPPDERVDAEGYLDILAEAVASRNGWRHILERCAPERRP